MSIAAVETKMITDRQHAFITTLWAERMRIELPELSTLTCKQASNLIGHLLECPKITPEAPVTPVAADVPEGRYAVELNGALRFYVVQYGKGRWSGRVFVSRQSSDNLLKISAHEAHEARRAIAQDARAAMVRYGRELGVCGVCGRALTDEESRAAGVGPICAARI